MCPRNFRDKDEVVSESFEWRIRQRAAVLARVSGTSRRRRSAFLYKLTLLQKLNKIYLS